MTVPYSDQFAVLLVRWRGSIWKSIKWHLSIFVGLYVLVAVCYRYALNTTQQERFQNLASYFREMPTKVPLSMMLSFYVNQIVSRWWEQTKALIATWPDRFMLQTALLIRGQDEQSKIIRRTLARYANLTNLLTYRDLSTRVRKRFPTVRHIVNGGLMTETEYEMYNSNTATQGKWLIPLAWMTNLIAVLYDRNENTDREINDLFLFVDRMRVDLGTLRTYDWFPLPLVYTHTVTIATYSYFAFALIGQQATVINEDRGPILFEFITPIVLFVEFLFYAGWLQVAQDLMNPFGEDDEDYELNFIIDRNLEISYMIVDNLYNELPPLNKDKHWQCTALKLCPTLPHTKASSKVFENKFFGHLVDFKLSDDDMKQKFHKKPLSYEKTRSQRLRDNIQTVGRQMGTFVRAATPRLRKNQPSINSITSNNSNIWHADCTENNSASASKQQIQHSHATITLTVPDTVL